MPDGLSSSDWSSIRAAYEAGRHQVFAVEDGHQARNPGQKWTTVFDGRGFCTKPDAGGWSFGLDLMNYGWGDASFSFTGDQPQTVTATGDRLEYAWDDRLTEWYVNDGRGLEHGYTVRERPAGASGPLSLELAVRGDLTPRVEAEGRDVRFVDETGAVVIRYAGLKVFDADGRALEAGFEGSAGWLHLSVEDQGARYPLTIDPVVQQEYLKASNTNASDQFGYAVAVSGDTVVVGAPYEASNATGIDGDESDNSLSGAGAAYIFVRSGTTWSQQAYVKSSNTGQNDHFGWVVEVSGDTVVVGAPDEDSNATGIDGNQSDNSKSAAGAVYVFVRSGTTWSQQAYVKASNTGADDKFGYAIAVSGDTVVAGALGEDSNATGIDGNESDNSAFSAGAAYVFVRSGTTWSQQAYVKASNTGFGDLFGRSVAVSGDTVVVGAYNEASNATGIEGNQSDNSKSGAGAAYVFVRSGTTWSQQAYVKASNTDAFDYFGWSVAVSGDTVVAGAFYESSNATGINGNESDNSVFGSGAAYVFVRSGTTWSQQAYVKASNTDSQDTFGSSVAVSGDTVVVGALGEASNATGIDGDQGDDSAVSAGATYVVDLDFQNGYFATYGAGTPGTGGFVPSIVLSGSWAISEDVTLSIADGLGGAPALLLMGSAQANIPFAGGALLVAPPWNSFPLTLGGTPGYAGAGALDVTDTLPDDPAIVGFILDFQVLVVDSAATKKLALSNGAELLIGG